MEEQFLDFMIMKQLMNISSENIEPISQTFINDMSLQTSQYMRFVECLPSVITLRPDVSCLLVDLIQIIVESLVEEQIAHLKKLILHRLIHNFDSKELLHRYSAITNFFTIAVKKSLFSIFDVANTVHSLMISKPKHPRILTEFFFWFGPEFSKLSLTFVRNLKHYAEIEKISRTLPLRYQTVMRRADEFMRRKWSDYETAARSEDPLKHAIQSDSLSVFKTLIKQIGANHRLSALPSEVHWMLFDNPTLAQVCAYFGAAECFNFLMKNGANLKLLDDRGRSIFDFAAVSCNTEIINCVLSAGYTFGVAIKSSVLFHRDNILQALPKLHPSEIGTSLNEAILGNNISAFAKCRPKASEDLLMYAVECESSAIIREMLSSWADALDLNKLIHGRSILHVAVQTHQLPVIEWFVASERVDVNVRDDAGKTPLQTAVETLDTCAIQILLGCERVDVNVRWEEGKSVLHEAILRGGIPAVASILECQRFDVNCADERGKTALHYATRNINTMGTHIVIDSGINNERLIPEKHVFSYSKLVHTEILRTMLQCERVRLDVFDNTGVFL